MKQRFLIKIGGLAFEKQEGMLALGAAMAASEDAEFIVLHGGGAEISQALSAAGRLNRFIDGVRVTPREDVEIVEQVLSRKVNQRIANAFEKSDVACQRMSGKTGNLFTVEPLSRNGQDLGYVGRISGVNEKVVEDALAKGRLPVISPVSGDSNAVTYNVNADSAASALAAAANCTDLVFFTDVPGVLVDGKRCVTLSRDEAKALIEAGTIKGGMVAKMEAAFKALDQGVARVHIMQWQGPRDFARLNCQQCDSGTTVCL